jgi:hypothetical protein
VIAHAGSHEINHQEEVPMARSVPDDIAARLRRLPPAQQRQALAYLETLERASHGAALAALKGSIPRDDLAEMAAAIEADCERVDWQPLNDQQNRARFLTWRLYQAGNQAAERVTSTNLHRLPPTLHSPTFTILRSTPTATLILYTEPRGSSSASANRVLAGIRSAG